MEHLKVRVDEAEVGSVQEEVACEEVVVVEVVAELELAILLRLLLQQLPPLPVLDVHHRKKLSSQSDNGDESERHSLSYGWDECGKRSVTWLTFTHGNSVGSTLMKEHTQGHVG